MLKHLNESLKVCKIKECRELLRGLSINNILGVFLAGFFAIAGTGLGGYITYKTQSNLLEMQFEAKQKEFIVFEYPKIKNKLRHSLNNLVETSGSLAYLIQVKNITNNNHDTISKFKEDYYEFIWAFERLYWFVEVYGHYSINFKLKDTAALVETLLLDKDLAHESRNLVIPFNTYCARLRSQYDELILGINKIILKEVHSNSKFND